MSTKNPRRMSSGSSSFITGLVTAAFLCLVGPATADVQHTFCFGSSGRGRNSQEPTDIYDFVMPDLLGQRNISLSQYRGKVALIVNVATYWGLTWHYHQLNALQRQFENELVILGFPCNQFGMQEPGGNGTEIMNGIKYVRPGNGFEPNFQLFQKIDVNGEKEHPLYTFLKSKCPPTREMFSSKERLFYTPFHVNDIRWNWEKFLIDKRGRPVLRYDPSTEPKNIARDISHLASVSYEYNPQEELLF